MIVAGNTSPKELFGSTWSATTRLSWRIASAVSLVLAVIVALVSYRYVLGIPPVPDGIAANAFGRYWLVLHAGFASTALFLGALQFSPVPRHRSPSFHRVVGRLYVVSCLVGALAGFVLALGTSAGLIASIGFGLLATAWTAVNVLGWQRAWTVCVPPTLDGPFLGPHSLGSHPSPAPPDRGDHRPPFRSGLPGDLVPVLGSQPHRCRADLALQETLGPNAASTQPPHGLRRSSLSGDERWSNLLPLER
jgi:hypothetical protein